MPVGQSVRAAGSTALVEQVLRAAVGHGLPGGAAWPTDALDPDEFAEILQRSMDDRLIGTLAQAASEGSFALLPEQRAQLAELHAAAQGHMLMLERLLLSVTGLFESAGIDHRVLKGHAIAHLLYDDPSWRNAADLDVLVPSESFGPAMELAIRELGAAPALAELRPGFDREFGKEVLLTVGKLELDLHRTFVTGPFGLTIGLGELFGDHLEFEVGDRTLRALGAEYLFLHACYGTALGDLPVRRGSVRDLLLCHYGVGVDLDRAVDTARRWGGVAVVQRAAQLVVDVAGPEVAGDLSRLTALDVPRREAWLLRSYLTPARSYSRPLASLAVIPGLRARVRYARAIVLPSPQYLDGRGWTTRDHVRRALRRLVGRD